MRSVDRLKIINARPGEFTVTSLLDWARYARDCDVPYIPVHVYDVISMEDLLAGPNLRVPDIFKDPGHPFMRRWDCCASYPLKVKMSGEDEPDYRQLIHPYADERAFDILFNYPHTEVAVLDRPWVPARKIDGYPVEYRVFVQDDKILGVSSYYPQRPLPYTYTRCKEISECMYYTTLLLSVIPPMEKWTQDIPGLDAKKRHFTVDFIVVHGNVYLLEGNPPHGDGGAHPCCFKVGQTYGIALSRQYDHSPAE